MSIADGGVTHVKFLWAPRVTGTILTAVFPTVFSTQLSSPGILPPIFSPGLSSHRSSLSGLYMLGLSPIVLRWHGLYPPGLYYPKLFPSSLGSQSLKQAAFVTIYFPLEASETFRACTLNHSMLTGFSTLIKSLTIKKLSHGHGGIFFFCFFLTKSIAGLILPQSNFEKMI